MDKLRQFGRKAWFIVRVMSGYEEKRIRSYRLQLQKRIEMAQARKEELQKLPEKVILSEVRQAVQKMQAVNQQLDEAEAAIDEYFKPIALSTSRTHLTSITYSGTMASSQSCRTGVAGLLRNLSSAHASTSAHRGSASIRSRCLSTSASSSNAQSSSTWSASSPSQPSSPSPSSSSSSSSAPAPRASSAAPAKPPKTVKTIPASSPLLDKPMPIGFPSSTLRGFPSLLHFADPVLDAHPSNVMRNKPTTSMPYPSSVTFFNEPRMFEPTPPSADSLVLSSGSDADEVNSEQYLSTVTPLSVREVRDLHRHAIVLKRVVHMTTKGKDASMYALVIAGNGNGLVGYGEGKDTNASKAGRKAFHEAVKTLDSVAVHKGSDGSRTIETQLEAKWGASTVVLRPRPAGFGLRVPPVIHAICRSVGITDLSASIQGSTNPVNVVKATLQILWGGAAPLGMGDGIGGQMRRKDKGRGMRSRLDIERSRGRRIIEVNAAK